MNTLAQQLAPLAGSLDLFSVLRSLDERLPPAECEGSELAKLLQRVMLM